MGAVRVKIWINRPGKVVFNQFLDFLPLNSYKFPKFNPSMPNSSQFLTFPSLFASSSRNSHSLLSFSSTPPMSLITSVNLGQQCLYLRLVSLSETLCDRFEIRPRPGDRQRILHGLIFSNSYQSSYLFLWSHFGRKGKGTGKAMYKLSIFIRFINCRISPFFPQCLSWYTSCETPVVIPLLHVC